jgi:cytochrome c biogenesis protein CcdA
MAVYNVAYIVPLAFIIALFIFTTGRYHMTETHGKILKGISGALMLALGLLMLLKPEAMIFN